MRDFKHIDCEVIYFVCFFLSDPEVSWDKDKYCAFRQNEKNSADAVKVTWEICSGSAGFSISIIWT